MRLSLPLGAALAARPLSHLEKPRLPKSGQRPSTFSDLTSGSVSFLWFQLCHSDKSRAFDLWTSHGHLSSADLPSED
jgi:hypothetical protein